MDVVGFGAMNFDLIYRMDHPERLSEVRMEWKSGREVMGSMAEFERIRSGIERIAKTAERSGGGSAANTVYALSRMGFETGYVGRVGADPEGDFLIERLQGVDTSRVRREGVSGVCIVVLDPSRDRWILLFPNTNDGFREEDLDLAYLRGGRFLHLSSFAGPSPFQAQVRAVKALCGQVQISLDPGEPYARKGMEGLRPILERCRILFATDSEISILTGRGYREGALRLLEAGPEIVACKKGPQGSHIFTSTGDLEVPPEPVEAVDTTGAGDVYDAGFLAGILLDLPIDRCAVLATRAAALSVTGFGRERYPDRAFLEHFLLEEKGCSKGDRP